jgi:hypothetical protein
MGIQGNNSIKENLSPEKLKENYINVFKEFE